MVVYLYPTAYSSERSRSQKSSQCGGEKSSAFRQKMGNPIKHYCNVKIGMLNHNMRRYELHEDNKLVKTDWHVVYNMNDKELEVIANEFAAFWGFILTHVQIQKYY